MSRSDDVLATPLQFLKGVGPRRAADLAHAGLITIEDLLYRFPLRYEDRSRLQPIATLKPGQTAEFPVQFYIDPAIADNANARDATNITLSYTFFLAKDQSTKVAFPLRLRPMSPILRSPLPKVIRSGPQRFTLALFSTE